MQKSIQLLLLICLGALVLRLGALAFVSFPGVADPNHYYNMGVRLVEGHGFTIDYIWQYSLPPNSIVHPEEHWMPLTAVLTAVPMQLFGVGVHAALLPFVVIGALLPALAYWGARQMALSAGAALFAAASVATLPEFVLNSVRTDTTIPSAFFVCLCLLLFTHGLRSGRWLAYVGAGAAAGLAYLTRSDGALLLPMALVSAVVYLVFKRVSLVTLLSRLVVFAVVALLVASPWIVRNLNEFGSPGSPETRSMFFFTHHDDHYAYGREFALETLLSQQSLADILAKRLFEMAAAVQMMITSLDVVLPLAVIGGALLLLAFRDRERLLALAPTLILLLGAFVAYTLFLPYKAQAGSFKKAYLSLLPLLLPLAGCALDRAIADVRIRRGALLLTLALLALNAVQRVRTDARDAATYLGTIEQMAAVARTLPDTNGDGDLILMTQDPYILRYVGLRSVIFPYEDRDIIAEVARRYHVDYLLMPPNRPSLDPLLTGAAADPRFQPVADVPGTQYTFFTAGSAAP